MDCVSSVGLLPKRLHSCWSMTDAYLIVHADALLVEAVLVVASCSCVDLEEFVVPYLALETCTYQNCIEDREDSMVDIDDDNHFAMVDHCYSAS